MRRGAALLAAVLAIGSASVPVAEAQSSSTLHGLNFSPYMDGQDPNTGSVVTEAQVRARMEIIAPFTRWVRSFGTTNGLEHVPPVARSLGLNVAAGAWVDSNESATLAQINSLIARAQAGQVDIAIVGNETQHFNRVTEAKLIEYITLVRQAIPAAIPVATVDTSNALLAHPNVIAASDVVMVTIYPVLDRRGPPECGQIGTREPVARRRCRREHQRPTSDEVGMRETRGTAAL